MIAQVKDNQSALLSTLEALCAGASPDSHHKTVDRKRHGRQEHRWVEIFDVEGKLDPDWNRFVTAAARVTRLTWRKDTKTGFWAQSEEVAFYACQTKLSAETAGHAIRNHWGIENRLNHVRDVSLFEDASRIRNKPGHFARMRTFVLNIFRANKVQNVSQELYLNALNPHNALGYQVM